MPIVNNAWRKAKEHCVARQIATEDECYVTIYSPRQTVIDDVADAYLSLRVPFEVLLLSLHRGEHQLYVSDSLKSATDKLVQLKRTCRISSAPGSACHLIATVSHKAMTKMLARRKDFRGYLREIGGDEVSRHLHKTSGLVLEAV